MDWTPSECGEVNRRVGLLQCQGGSRRIDKALDLADKEVLTPAGGVRDVSRVNQFSINIYLMSYHRSWSDCNVGMQALSESFALLLNLVDPKEKPRLIFVDFNFGINGEILTVKYMV